MITVGVGLDRQVPIWATTTLPSGQLTINCSPPATGDWRSTITWTEMMLSLPITSTRVTCNGCSPCLEVLQEECQSMLILIKLEVSLLLKFWARRVSSKRIWDERGLMMNNDQWSPFCRPKEIPKYSCDYSMGIEKEMIIMHVCSEV